MDYGTLPSAVPATATLVFDGYWGFCTRSAGWLDSLDRAGRVELVAAQQIGADHGLSCAETAAAAWTVAPDVRVGGARAAALAVAVARQSSIPLLPWRVPGMPWLLDRVYECVARYRYRLPGVTPWCVDHEGACLAASDAVTR